MLIGRHAERERLEALVARAQAGGSGALLLSGPAGIGKTALVRETVELGRRRGMALLGARGIEAETDVPFAGLHELLAPAIGLRRDLPEHHRRALEVALGLESGPAPDPFAVAAALLAFLGAAAERHGSVLVVVDDAHWLDPGSLDALLFVVRRLHAEGVAVLISARPTPDRGLDDRGLDELVLEGLPDDDARAVVRLAAGDGATDPACRRIAAAARGYPLALVELGRSLAADPGRDPADDAVPQRPSHAVERVFRDDLARLSPGARYALVLAAADERASRTELLAALAPAGHGAAQLDEAEQAGLLERDGLRLRFRHPLVQAVVYHGATSAEHDAVHRALAAVLPPERAVWHRAAAADGPDEAVAADLEAAGAAARTRGDLAAAAVALRRAAALTPAGVEAARRTLLAAELSMAAGDLPASRVLSERALAGEATPEVRVDLERIRATALGRMGELEAGVQPLIAHADRIAATDPRRAALLLLGAGPAFWFSGRFDRFSTVVDRAVDLAGDEHPVEGAMAGLLRAMVDVNVGRVPEAEAGIALHGHVLEHDDLPDPGYEVLASPAQVSVWTGRLDRADELIERQLAVARRAGAAAALVYPLTVRGQLDLRRGRASSALAVGAEAVSLGRETRQTVLVGLGRAADAAEAVAALAARAERSPTPWTVGTVARGRALLAPKDEAIAEHERAIAAFEGVDDALEAARQRLALGERLRRGRQRRLAREPLRAALVDFERAGATPWAARTAVELRATGGAGTSGAERPAHVEELTPRELRALLVADGRTNPEVAAELFLSRKTVEHHLSQIYRKLGLRSRTELARELAGA